MTPHDHVDLVHDLWLWETNDPAEREHRVLWDKLQHHQLRLLYRSWTPGGKPEWSVGYEVQRHELELYRTADLIAHAPSVELWQRD